MRIVTLFAFACLAGCTAPKTGILVMAHGGDPEWNRDVEATVAPLRDRQPVEIAFGMATTSTIRDAVTRLEAQGVRRVAVVRMFISGDSFIEPTEYILGLRDSLPDDPHAAHAAQATGHEDHSGHHMEAPERIATKASFVLSRHGVAESPLIDEILADRVRALSTDPQKERVLLLAHGPGDDSENQRWLANMKLRARRIHDVGPFRDVRCETLREDWPEKRAPAESRIRTYIEEGNRHRGRVIVIPFRVAGFGPYKEVLEGMQYVADGKGFCPHRNMTRWIEETAKKCAKGPSNTNEERHASRE
jgi:hypothetical protein